MQHIRRDDLHHNGIADFLGHRGRLLSRLRQPVLGHRESVSGKYFPPFLLSQLVVLAAQGFGDHLSGALAPYIEVPQATMWPLQQTLVIHHGPQGSYSILWVDVVGGAASVKNLYALFDVFPA